MKKPVKDTKTNKTKWWFTHKKLRAIRSCITNALPHVFTYIGHYKIPRTTNLLEGGINSRLKELLRIHRGMNMQHKKVLTSIFLKSKIAEKPTGNVT